MRGACVGGREHVGEGGGIFESVHRGNGRWRGRGIGRGKMRLE